MHLLAEKDKPMRATVNGLWIQHTLSPLELLCIQSFMDNGFSFQLWTYTPGNINAPEGCIIRDANEIIPAENIFRYTKINKHGHGKGSYAGFSDIFRYRLLYQHGGIWTDMDITCLKNFHLESDYFFRYHHKAGAVGNFMKCPPFSPLMEWCYNRAVKEINADNEDWMLPIRILNEGIERFHLEQYIGQISNDDSFPVVASLLRSAPAIPAHWNIIHWMNEEFRRMDISKDICLSNSLLHQLYEKHHIVHRTYKGAETFMKRWRLSRLYYLGRNVKSTLLWYLSPH